MKVWDYDEDYWCFHDYRNELKDLGYHNIESKWYRIEGSSLDAGMK